MKKFILLFLIIGGSAATIFLGVGGQIHGFSSGRFSHVVTQPGVNYYYLSDPLMVVADEMFYYVLNQDFEDTFLLTIRRGDRTLVATSQPLPEVILDMDIAGGYIFMFATSQYHVLPVALARATQTDCLLNLADSFFYGTTQVNRSFFGVTHIAVNTFAISSAQGSSYGFHTLTISGGGFVREGFNNRTLTGQTIRGIAMNVTQTVFLLASVPPSNLEFAIFQSGSNDPLLSGTHFSVPTAFTILHGEGFLMVDNNRRIVFQNETDATFVAAAPLGGTWTRLNYHPIFIFARAISEILVVDTWKNSIDHYVITGNNMEFAGTALASRGNDHGFFNDPASMTMVGEGKLLVSDFSETVRLIDRNKSSLPTPFVLQNISVVNSMAFDNYQTVFMYEIGNRIVRFDLEGNRVGNPITTYWDGHAEFSFGRISQLVADLSTRIVYALDPLNDMLYRFVGGRFELVPITNFVITAATRMAVDNHNNRLFFINAMTLSGETRHVFLDGTQIAFTFTDPATVVRDIVVDTLGNPFVLTQVNNQVFLYHFTSQPGGGFTQWRTQLEGATIGFNPSLNFDRLNSIVYWIGAKHAVEAVHMRQNSDPVWSFRHNWGTSGGEWYSTERPHYDWENLKPLEKPTELFADIKTGGTVLYEFPSSINPKGFLLQGRTVMILQSFAKYPGADFNYALVLPIGHTVPSFVNREFLNIRTDYFRTKNMFDVTVSENNQSGLVVSGNAQVLKYPTTVKFPMSLHSLPQSFNANAGGLRVERRITIGDIQGMEFFEIRINASGAPDILGGFVGYVSVDNVIDFFSHPSSKVLVSNARVSIPSDRTYQTVSVYSDHAGIELVNGITLANNQEVRINGRLDRTREFTFVQFWEDWGDGNGRLSHGYIRTEYIVPNTLTLLQLLGIILASLGAVAVIVFLALHMRRKKGQGYT